LALLLASEFTNHQQPIAAKSRRKKGEISTSGDFSASESSRAGAVQVPDYRVFAREEDGAVRDFTLRIEVPLLVRLHILHTLHRESSTGVEGHVIVLASIRERLGLSLQD
jgi:hypothetical protein